MAKTISSMNVLFGATVAPFVRGVQAASGAVDGFVAKVGSAGASVARFTGIGAGIAGAFGAIKGAASGLTIATDLEQTAVAFTTMLRSADAAKAMMEQLTAFAAETPFEFPELAKSAKSLLAFGVSAGQIQPALRKIGDISAGIGAPIGEIAELFGKAKVQGTLYAEDINQLVGRGIPVIQQFAKQLGVSESQVKKMASEGKISFGMLDKAFTDLTSNGGQFAGMMAAQSRTLGGLWSTFTDNVGMSAAGLVTTLVDAFNLKGALAALSGAIGTGGAKLNAAVRAWAPTVVGGLNAVWSAVSGGFAKAWDALAPYFAQVSAFVSATTGGAVDAIRGASFNTSDALATVGGTLGTVVLAWAGWNAAVFGGAAALATARGAVIAFDGALLVVGATTRAATLAQAGLSMAVAGASAVMRAAGVAGTFLSGVYASVRGAAVILAAANAGLSFGQAALNTLTIAGGVAQLAYATTLGAVRSAFAGLTVTQGLWKAATMAGTAAQWLLNAALTANPIGIVVVGLGALAAWLGYSAVQSGIFATALGGLQTACDFASFAFQNFGLVARAGVTGAAFELVRFGNVAAHFFTVQIPAYLGWFASNWRNVFTTSFNLVSAIFTNMGTNVAAFFRGLKSWMSGDGFDFKWTALTTGFESTMSELPKIAERQVGPLEGQLAKQFEDANAAMRKGFDDFRKGKDVKGPEEPEQAKAPKPPDPITVPPPFKFEDIKPAIDTKPADAALDKTKEKAKQTHDAIANIGSGSAEQMKRIAAATFEARGALGAVAATAAKPALGKQPPALAGRTLTMIDAKPAPGRAIASPGDYLNRNPNGAVGSAVQAFPLPAGGAKAEPVRALPFAPQPVDKSVREPARERSKREAESPTEKAILIELQKQTKLAETKDTFEIVEF